MEMDLTPPEREVRSIEFFRFNETSVIDVPIKNVLVCLSVDLCKLSLLG